MKLDLSNYDVSTGVDASSFAKKVDLVNLKSDVNKLDIDKLKRLRPKIWKIKYLILLT